MMQTTLHLHWLHPPVRVGYISTLSLIPPFRIASFSFSFKTFPTEKDQRNFDIDTSFTRIVIDPAPAIMTTSSGPSRKLLDLITDIDR
jgi:hypothetical protein